MDDETSGAYIAGAVPEEAKESINNAVDWVADTASDAWSTATDATEQAVDWVSQEAQSAGEDIVHGAEAAGEWIEEHKEDLLM
jgi:hypothetical protein